MWRYLKQVKPLLCQVIDTDSTRAQAKYHPSAQRCFFLYEVLHLIFKCMSDEMTEVQYVSVE